MAEVNITIYGLKDWTKVAVNVYEVNLVWKQPWANWDFQWVKEVGSLIMSFGTDSRGLAKVDFEPSEYYIEAVEDERSDGPRIYRVKEGINRFYLHLPLVQAPPEKGILTLESKTRIYLDGKDVGTGRVMKQLEVGSHTVSFEEPNKTYTPNLQVVDVKAGETRNLKQEFKPPKPWSKFNLYMKRR